MSTAARLGIYTAAVLAVFAIAYLLGDLLVPEHVVANWLDRAAENTHAH